MRTILLTCLTALGLLFSASVMGQGKTVTGTITDANTKETLPGVNVVVKGTTIGAMTDNEGAYSIKASVGQVLQFSSIGYIAQEITVGEDNQINVALTTNYQALNEVVVTALGIKKEKKALGYSVQDIKNDELMKNKSTNVINSLSGKIAGVSVTQSGGSAGAGSSIIIRGGTSLERDNQPLFVVDGIIYDNSTPVGGDSGFDGSTRNSTTYGNRVMDINPEDIESMSILKGPAATALYGSRAADGVIIISTKKGQEGVVQVNISSKFTSSWVNRLPEQQSTYKRGYYNSAGVFSDFTTTSWGDKFTATDKVYNNIGDFFEKSNIFDNSVSISGGSSNQTFYLSGSRYNQTGIIPGTGYDKSTFRFNGDQKYGKLTVGANVAYSVANTDKTLTSAGLYDAGGNGAMTAVYGWARSDDMKHYLNDDGSKYRMFEGLQDLSSDLENPYWIVNKNKLSDKIDRLTTGVNISFKVANWFDISYRAGLDNYTKYDYTFIAPGGAVSETYQNGRLSESDINYEYLSSNLMLNFKKKISDFDLNLLVGQSAEDTKTITQRRTGYNFVTAGIYSFENISADNKFQQSLHSRKRLMGLYSEFRASYKNFAYITFTGRNDWTSTLPVDNRSYFYPSVSGSFVFSELIPQNNILSFGKIRASWAQVGKDTEPYYTSTTLWSPRTFLAGVGLGNSWTRGNPYLKPEITESSEFGLEMRFLSGRLGFDFTYYNNNSKNQIVTPRLSQTTGYILLSANVGNVRNKGMELSINAVPVQKKDFKWDLTLNLSGNRGRVEHLLTGQDVLYVTDVQVGNVKAASFNNGIFSGLSGSKWSRDDNGKVILDWATGMPTSDNSTTKLIGNREPKFVGGLNNSIQYKNFNLSFLLDLRVGGDIYNGTDYYMTTMGMSPKSLNRTSLKITGVAKNPSTNAYEDKEYTITDKYLIEQYWQNKYALESANFMTKTSWLRLRSISLSYNLPESIIKRQNVIKGLSVTVAGTNLWVWTNYKGMDPETSVAGSGVIGSGSSGVDYCGVPATAGFSVGLNMTF
jgi:ferric enterobactin receptor